MINHRFIADPAHARPIDPSLIDLSPIDLSSSTSCQSI
jgi:hypothetical protein